MNVIAKVMGMEFKVENLRKESSAINSPFSSSKPIPPIDPNLPCSDDNSWVIRFSNEDNDASFSAHPSPSKYDLSHGSLVFEDITGHAYSWFFHWEVEEEDGRLLFPGSHPIAAAVGVRLVNFFGGSVLYKDSQDEDEPGALYRCSVKRAKMPPRTKEQTSNDRWAQFQNLLLAEPILTVKELELARKKVALPNAETADKLIERLRIEEERMILDQASAPARGVSRSSPRL